MGVATKYYLRGHYLDQISSDLFILGGPSESFGGARPSQAPQGYAYGLSPPIPF